MSDDDTTTLITPGTWKAKALGALLGYTKGGNDQVGIGFVILEGPSQGQSITYYGQFGEASLEFTLGALRNSGWIGDDLADLSGVGVTDVSPYLVIAHEEFDGKVSARVKWVNAGGAIAMKEVMGRGEAQAFSQRMRGSVMAFNAKTAAKSGGARPAAPATGRTPASHAAAGGGGFVDDDIPF